MLLTHGLCHQAV